MCRVSTDALSSALSLCIKLHLECLYTDDLSAGRCYRMDRPAGIPPCRGSGRCDRLELLALSHVTRIMDRSVRFDTPKNRAGALGFMKSEYKVRREQKL